MLKWGGFGDVLHADVSDAPKGGGWDETRGLAVSVEDMLKVL